MEYSKGMEWIGDLSLEDADLLAQYGKNYRGRILEFGCGGSTQIFAQSSNNEIISVDTDSNWISVTQKRLNRINKAVPVRFMPYTVDFEGRFDIIFVDGIDHLRREFAIATWKYLAVGGVMLFHDTRRSEDFQNVARLAQLFHNEIDLILVNASASNHKSSNITVIRKKASEPYVNWNNVEGKPKWSYGTLEDDQPLWT